MLKRVVARQSRGAQDHLSLWQIFLTSSGRACDFLLKMYSIPPTTTTTRRIMRPLRSNLTSSRWSPRGRATCPRVSIWDGLLRC